MSPESFGVAKKRIAYVQNVQISHRREFGAYNRALPETRMRYMENPPDLLTVWKECRDGSAITPSHLDEAGNAILLSVRNARDISMRIKRGREILRAYVFE